MSNATETNSTRDIELGSITVDPRVQSRASLDADTIAEYSDAMRCGQMFAPLVVYEDDDKVLWLADGFHRYEAYSKTGATKVRCNVVAGSMRQAILHSVGANVTHGLRRTHQDKRRAVQLMLQDQEWKCWTDAELARRTYTSPTFVAKMRSMVTSNVSSDGQPCARRYVTKHGTVATMDTTNIGAKLKEAQEPKPAETDDDGPTEPITSLPDSAPLKAALARIQDARRTVAALAPMEVGAFINVQRTDLDLKNAYTRVKHGAPHATCPYCHNAQPQKSQCKACRRLGWVPKFITTALGV